MNKYKYDEWENEEGEMVGWMFDDPRDDGEYYHVEDVDPIIADRDIKSANLKTLVDMVLAYKHPGAGPDNYPAQDYYDMVELARGLKQ